MKADNFKPQVVRFVFPVGHGVAERARCESRQSPRAVQRTIAILGSWTFCTGSRNLEPSFPVVVKAAHTLTITIECVEKFAVCISCADVESPALAGCF